MYIAILEFSQMPKSEKRSRLLFKFQPEVPVSVEEMMSEVEMKAEATEEHVQNIHDEAERLETEILYTTDLLDSIIDKDFR